jgi:hypothetical protein
VATDEDFDGLKASDFLTPRGQTIRLLSPPFSGAAAVQSSTMDGINVLPAFSEGNAAAYAIAEAWRGLDQVWVQPWWVLVTGWAPANPTSLRLSATTLPVVDVGTDSFFYSPYWQVIYAETSAQTDPDHYRWSSDILGDGLPLHNGNGIFALLASDTFGISVATGAPGATRPYTGERVAKERHGNAWKEGQKLPDLSFTSSFSWDQNLVVAESPLYMFTRVDGTTPALEIPAIIGVGAPGSPAGGVTTAGVPEFGYLSRMYTMRIPSTAGLFIPPDQDGLRPAFTVTNWVRIPTVHSDITTRFTPAQLDVHLLKVAMDAECFSSAAITTTNSNVPLGMTVAQVLQAKRDAFPASCGFLDSQQAVEKFMPAANVTRHDMLFTTPVLFFNGKPVGTP